MKKWLKNTINWLFPPFNIGKALFEARMHELNESRTIYFERRYFQEMKILEKELVKKYELSAVVIEEGMERQSIVFKFYRKYSQVMQIVSHEFLLKHIEVSPDHVVISIDENRLSEVVTELLKKIESINSPNLHL